MSPKWGSHHLRFFYFTSLIALVGHPSIASITFSFISLLISVSIAFANPSSSSSNTLGSID